MNSKSVSVGERLATSINFSSEQSSSFARLVGDLNPIHHDLAAAQRASYPCLVVSGPELSSRLMGMTATHFSSPGPNAEARSMLGLEFRFRFHRPVFCGEQVELNWQVVSLHEKPSLGGTLVLLAGGVRNAAGEAAVKASGKVLVR